MNALLTPKPLRIVDVYNDGEASRHFTFEPVSYGAEHKALPGQFFALTVPGHGEAAFTYLSLPDAKGRFSALVRQVGALTTALFDCKAGDILGYRGPFGRGGWPIDKLHGRRVLILAGGCGLAPLASAIETLRADASTKVALLFGSSTPAAQVLGRERAVWREQMPLVETFDMATSGGCCVGTPLDYVDEIIPQLGGEPEAVLSCGPEGMMNAVGRGFIERGLAADRIWLAMERRMHCGVGLCGHCYLGSSYVCVDGPVYRWDELSRLRSQTTSINRA